MKNLVLIFLFCSQLLFAQSSADTQTQVNEEQAQETLSQEELDKRAKIQELKLEINEIRLKLEDNILLKRYSNYIAYRQISDELFKLEEAYKEYETKKGEKYKELEYQTSNKIRIKKNELELIAEYKDSPIGNLINPPEIQKSEPVTNPFGIINAYSDIKKLENNKVRFKKLYEDIEGLTELLEKKIFLNLELYEIEPTEALQLRINFLMQQKKDFNMVLEIVSTTNNVYSRKIEQVILEIQSQISNQVEKSVKIFMTVFVLLIVSFLIKLTLKRYFFQNENYYMVNKIINFVIVFLVIMVVLFSYIDNVSYLVTILGFASAGIAIALKDWFMSIFG